MYVCAQHFSLAPFRFLHDVRIVASVSRSSLGSHTILLYREDGKMPAWAVVTSFEFLNTCITTTSAPPQQNYSWGMTTVLSGVRAFTLTTSRRSPATPQLVPPSALGLAASGATFHLTAICWLVVCLPKFSKNTGVLATMTFATGEEISVSSWRLSP